MKLPSAPARHSPHARWLDGQREVPLEAVVPGDVVLLSAGALVPADALAELLILLVIRTRRGSGQG